MLDKYTNSILNYKPLEPWERKQAIGKLRKINACISFILLFLGYNCPNQTNPAENQLKNNYLNCLMFTWQNSVDQREGIILELHFVKKKISIGIHCIASTANSGGGPNKSKLTVQKKQKNIQPSISYICWEGHRSWSQSQLTLSEMLGTPWNDFMDIFTVIYNAFSIW